MAKFTFTYVEQPIKAGYDAPICKLPETVDFKSEFVAKGDEELKVVNGGVKVPTFTKAGYSSVLVTKDKPFVVETDNEREIAFYTAVVESLNRGDFATLDCIEATIDAADAVESI